jgi:two-component system NtrC family sensor kinase
MKSRNQVVLAIAAILFLIVMVMEWMFPLNVVGAFGFVLPILLVATVRSRRLMVVTLALCILVTFVGLFQPGKKRERFTAVVFNRIMVACVLTGVAYIGVTWEERKAREEAAKAALATQTEHLLLANTQLVEIKDKLARSERLAAVGQLVASVAHEVGTPLHSIAWHVEALAEEPGVTPAMQKRIGIIDEQLNRVVRIIQDLLSSTRQRKPEPTWYPAERLIEPVVALMEPGYHAKGVTCFRHRGGAGSAGVGRCRKDPPSVGQSPEQCTRGHRGGGACHGRRDHSSSFLGGDGGRVLHRPARSQYGGHVGGE